MKGLLLIVNRTAYRLPILGYDKRMVFEIPAGESRVLPDAGRDDPFEGRFEEIVYQANGDVQVVESKDWKRPKNRNGEWWTELVNIGPNKIEAYNVDDQYFMVFRGIPRLIKMPLVSPDILFQEIRFVPDKKQTTHHSDPRVKFDYVTSRLEKIWRNPFDMEAVKKQIAKEVSDEIKSGNDRRLENLPKEKVG